MDEAQRTAKFLETISEFHGTIRDIAQCAFQGMPHPLENSFTSYARLWDKISLHQQVQLYVGLAQENQATLLSTATDASWLNRNVCIKIGQATFYMGTFYEHAMTMASKAIQDTRGLPAEAIRMRPEIVFPQRFLHSLYTLLVLACGYENEYTALKNRLVAVEEAMHIRTAEDDAAKTVFEPMMNVFNALVDGAIVDNAQIPPSIANSVHMFRDKLNNTNADPLTKMTTALSDTMKSQNGQEAMNYLRSLMGGEPMVSSMFDHMTSATSMEDGFKRMSELASNPEVMNLVKTKTHAAMASSGSAPAAPVNFAPPTEDIPIA